MYTIFQLSMCKNSLRISTEHGSNAAGHYEASTEAPPFYNSGCQRQPLPAIFF